MKTRPGDQRGVRRGRSALRGGPTAVNDVHSRLNPTLVASVVAPRSVAEVRRVVQAAARAGRGVSIAGGRHAMGGQQFGTGTVLLDTRRLDRVLHLDRERGTVEVEAGIQWPALIRHLLAAQTGAHEPWGIVQKQTGADRLTLGGAVAANIHGRGLRMQPLIGDVEALTLLDAQGEVHRCSREESPEMFRLVVGGYGLLGVVTTVSLRLAPRRKLERVVDLLDVEALLPELEQRVRDGHLYGDFQFAIDPSSDGFLRRGILSTYRPVHPATPLPADQRVLSPREWRTLLHLAHRDKAAAFERYCEHYLATAGQIYWSDTHQLSYYHDDYHRELDAELGGRCRASEMISELYVPRAALPGFMAEIREDLRAHGSDVIYGTVRLIERDTESCLAWAREAYACVVLNLHVEHSADGVQRAAGAFRRLIDAAIRRGGSFYLTYHRYATREQLLACYPQFPAFLERKREHDPQERFRSDWYRHCVALLQGRLPVG